jgi:lysophospholipase L1-like esterase
MPVFGGTPSTGDGGGGGGSIDAAGVVSGTFAPERFGISTIGPTKLTFEAATVPQLGQAILTMQPLDPDLTAFAGLNPSENDMLIRQAGAWKALKIEDAKILLGVGSGGSNRPTSLVALDGGLTSRTASPTRIVFTGSSTTAGSNASAPAKRWVNQFMSFLQTTYPSGTNSETVTAASTSADFTLSNSVGVQGLNAGEGSTTSATFLTTAEMDKISAADPSAIFYMIGSNDFRTNRSIATFKADLQSKIDYLKTKLTRKPCSHIIVAAYEPWDITGTVPWINYVNAMKEIADADTNRNFFVNLNPLYISYMIPGAKGAPSGAGAPDTDPFGLISSDKLHQNDKGHEQMARWVYQAVMGVPAPTAIVTPPGNGTAAPVTDNFSRTNTSSLQAATSGQTWSTNTGTTWQTDGSVAFMSAGANGLATIACGYADVTFAAKVRRPTTGTCGIRVRQTEGANTGMALYYSSSDNVIYLSTVINNTISSKDSIPIPAGIAVGDYATLTLSANGPEIIGYVNGERMLSTTLSTADMNALPGTSIALRQTAAGIGAGAFDDIDAKAYQIIVPPAAGTTANDAFNRASSTTSMGVADSGQTWTSGNAATWGISPDGKAYMVALNGATGGALALLPVGLTDVDFTAEFLRPSSTAFTGIAVRATGMSSRIAVYVDVAANQLVLSTVENNTNSARDTEPLPTSSVPVGSVMKVRLTVIGAQVNAYLNNAATPTLTWTLTGTQLTGITGTDIGLRQNSSGVANGSFDNLVVLNAGTSGPEAPIDTAAFPTTDLPGWKLQWRNDFNITFPLGQAKATYGSDLFGYDWGTDTSDWGIYNSDKTITGIAGNVDGANGVLQIEAYYNATDDQYWQGAITPPGPTVNGTQQWGQLSGRYSIRMRCIENVKGTYTRRDGTIGNDTGIKFVALNWPAINPGMVDPKGVTVIDGWDYGEINFPEGNTAGTVEGFSHFATGSAGNRSHDNALQFAVGEIFGAWHTYTVEWIAGVSVKYFLDGVQKAQAPASGVPYVKMYWSIRTETWLDRGIAPPKVGHTKAQIDWAASYTKV